MPGCPRKQAGASISASALLVSTAASVSIAMAQYRRLQTRSALIPAAETRTVPRQAWHHRMSQARGNPLLHRQGETAKGL